MNTSTIKDAKEVLRFAKDQDVETIDFKFLGLVGQWHAISRTVGSVDERLLQHGIGLGGLTVRGWEDLGAQAVVLRPDLTTVRVDPMRPRRSVSVLCALVDPLTGAAYGRDPRGVVRRAEEYLTSGAVADELLVSAAVDFYAFSDVRYEERVNAAFYMVDTPAGHWNTGNDERPNLGHKARFPGAPSGPSDVDGDLRQRIVSELSRIGIPVVSAQATGAPGQHRVELGARGLLAAADHIQWLKHVARGLGRSAGRAVTFMPQPLAGCLGSGMPLRISMRRGSEHVFVGDMYAGLSDTALHFVGGILKHAPALAAFVNPTVNSYRRVAAPDANVLGYSSRDGRAAVRIPSYSPDPKAKRVEYGLGDPSANASLALAAFVMAGMHGVERRLDPGEPIATSQRARVYPSSLAEALNALEADHKWLTRGGVFSEDLIETWIRVHREDDVAPLIGQPTPGEFARYFGL